MHILGKTLLNITSKLFSHEKIIMEKSRKVEEKSILEFISLFEKSDYLIHVKKKSEERFDAFQNLI